MVHLRIPYPVPYPFDVDVNAEEQHFPVPVGRRVAKPLRRSSHALVVLRHERFRVLVGVNPRSRQVHHELVRLEIRPRRCCRPARLPLCVGHLVEAGSPKERGFNHAATDLHLDEPFIRQVWYHDVYAAAKRVGDEGGSTSNLVSSRDPVHALDHALPQKVADLRADKHLVPSANQRRRHGDRADSAGGKVKACRLLRVVGGEADRLAPHCWDVGPDYDAVDGGVVRRRGSRARVVVCSQPAPASKHVAAASCQDPRTVNIVHNRLLHFQHCTFKLAAIVVANTQELAPLHKERAVGRGLVRVDQVKGFRYEGLQMTRGMNGIGIVRTFVSR